MDAVVTLIKDQIKTNPVLLYMKGSPSMPQCGFSARAVQCLNACQASYATVNVLDAPEIRKMLPTVSNWPTFPQLFINGELIGGCDIVVELYENGTLATLLAPYTTTEK